MSARVAARAGLPRARYVDRARRIATELGAGPRSALAIAIAQAEAATG